MTIACGQNEPIANIEEKPAVYLMMNFASSKNIEEKPEVHLTVGDKLGKNIEEKPEVNLIAILANHELYSAYLYLYMSLYFESIEMKGLAQWTRMRSEEDLLHAVILDFIADSWSKSSQPIVDGPRSTWGSPLQALQYACEHESAMTRLIYALKRMAEAEKNDSTAQFLEWYVEAQEDEEESAYRILSKVKAAGEDQAALEAIDRELWESSSR
ncbi:MAG: ferritin [Methanothrix sp.]